MAALLASLGVARAADAPGQSPLPAAPIEAKVPVDGAVDATLSLAKTLEEHFKSKDDVMRKDTAVALGRIDHASVAAMLMKQFGKEKAVIVREALIDALGTQKASVAKAGPALAAIVNRVVASRVEQRKKGKPPIPLDETGKPLTTPDALKAVAARRAESREAAFGVRAVRRLDARPADPVATLRELLLDSDDNVVVEVLESWTAWKVAAGVYAVRDLFKMYPTPLAWEGAEIVDFGGTEASAKSMWEARHGDPASHRPRPRVVDAVHKYFVAAIGRDFKDPKELTAWIAAEDEPSKGKKPK